ncbi:MAG: DUF5916 domain-containing protein [Melioribacter sp.]|uniref:carbohydrate binding family 9 domain-containing protein n=1 Tax=Melioribacter sp. TaxID=2052167 RepID=UPI003BCA8170
MKKSVLLLLLPLIIYAANEEKVMKLKKIDTDIKVDGIIDEIWSVADSTDDFFQLSPYYSQAPSRRTVAKILSTENSLFCLIISYDDPKNIQRYTGKLDDASGDVVSIMLDTFGDRKTAYKFAVSASNVRADCRLLDDARNRDYNWDGIWFSAAKIYNWGFVVEIEIPYKSLQYDENLQFWGLDFDRWIPKLKEDLYWCVYEQNEGQRISKFGKLVFDQFKPSVKGLNLEIYPTTYGKYSSLDNKLKPNFGLDIFYNPSPQLTFQATANPDFAQIEADPYNFNITRYETYFSEKRPFFIQGNEIFMPAGKQRNWGFYRPMELFYSRRIGKLLPGGKETPINFGAKAFGRIGVWQYGGFIARTPEVEYTEDDSTRIEPSALFVSGRLKRQIMENSEIGVLFVGKQTAGGADGVLDIDGAFRNSNWQLAYQLARSIQNSKGDYAASMGYTNMTNDWIVMFRSRYVGNDFNIDQVGYVPWRGTFEAVGLAGPVWFMDKGAVSQILIYTGPAVNYEKVDAYTDRAWVFGFNMQFRSHWGYEINTDFGKAKDDTVKYDYYSINFSSWINPDPSWWGNVWGGYSKTYNFSREYLAFYSWAGASFGWNITNFISLGASTNLWIEGNPDNKIEEITFNTRPWISVTPLNDLNFYIYIDNLFLRSSDQMERIFVGALFSYQFLPKSWIYLAINDLRERNDRRAMASIETVSVFKIKYLYYF